MYYSQPTQTTPTPLTMTNIAAPIAIQLENDLTGFTPKIHAFATKQDAITACKSISQIHPKNATHLICWETLTIIGRSCEMALNSKDFQRAVIQRIPLPEHAVYTMQEPGTRNVITGQYTPGIVQYVLAKEFNACWAEEVKLWIKCFSKGFISDDSASKERVHDMMIKCFTVNISPVNGYVELSMFAPI